MIRRFELVTSVKETKNKKKRKFHPIAVALGVVLMAVFSIWMNWTTISTASAQLTVADPAVQALIQKLILERYGQGVSQAALTPQQRSEIQRDALSRANLAYQIRQDKLGEALGVAYKNLMFSFTGQIAQDLAVYVVNGDHGKPLAFTENWGDYLETTAQNAAADFVATFARQSFGVNICAQPALKLQLSIGLGKLAKPNNNRIQCNWDQLSRAWDVGNDAFLDNFAAGFDIKQNPVGIALTGLSGLQEAVLDKEQQALLERQGKIFKDKTTSLTKQILTPGELLRYQYEDFSTITQEKRFLSFTSSWVADTFNVFTSTLVQELLKKYKTGHWSLADLKRARSLTDPVGAGSSTTTSAALAARSARALGTPNLISANDFNWVQEMAFCPDDSRNATIWNCTIDQKFLQALNSASTDTSPLTVGQALEKGMLRGEWPFGYTDPASEIEPSYNEGYAYSNMIKLRRARILPIGWEMAARKTFEIGYSATLQQVVDGFYDENSPFYRMVDPNWLLKQPLVDCRIQTYGQLADNSGVRQEYCADIRDCVDENADGSCNSYGYCQREKNIFRFAGTECSERNATCETFTRTVDNQSASYIESTVSKTSCTPDSAGCRWYATDRAGDGQWTDINRLYLTRQAQDCASNDAGCREFLKLTNIQNGLSVNQVINQVTSDPNDSYQNYANVESIYLNGSRIQCVEEEVGCNQYTPVAGGAAVTAVAQANDICPSECVGYDHFTQEANFFERSQSAYFIPATAQKCEAAVVGCSEFTNLDAVGQGGESTEYYTYLRQCQKPFEDDSANTDCAEYITWKGSDVEGYQIERFTLKATDTTNLPGNNGFGAPATTDGSVDCEDRTSPDCKQFYDSAGNVYYRDFTKTISCSSNCIPYRKSESRQIDCENTNGTWTNGACIYNAIPEQGIQCVAAESGCRAYRGNVNDNTRILASDNFEDADFLGWSANSIGISSESGNIGGRSLRFQTDAQFNIANQLTQNKDYSVEVYIKNSLTIPTRINVKLGAASSDRSTDLTLGSIETYRDEWNLYTFGGPLTLSRAPLSNEALIFEVTDLVGNSLNQDIFIDNFTLREVQSALYAIKDSWNTPNSCETDPPLAGGTANRSMIGCKAYTDIQGTQRSFKSFGQLCAPEKIGCEAMVDTQNSSSPVQQTFNAGDPSQVTVPADELAYVVNNPDNYCGVAEKGCTALGLPTLDENDVAASYADVYRKVDPDKFSSILCRDDQLGCEEYSKEDNQTLVYFKDPGPKVCEYKVIPGSTPVRYAWFKQGDEDPANANPPECVCEKQPVNENTDAWFRIDDPFNTLDHPTCVATFGNAPENDWVRGCPPGQSGCTEFIQPVQCEYVSKNNKLDWYKKGTSILNPEQCERYYYIDDNQIDGQVCNGTVDWKNGCVLFNNVENQSLLFKSGDDTDYVGAPQACNGTDDPECNANILLRVKRDRVCGEWLSCQSSQRVFDERTGEYREICYAVGTCTESKDDEVNQCAVWKTEAVPQELTEQLYQSRVIGWSGKEYSGWSIPGQYPVATLTQRSYARDAEGNPDDFRLTYIQPAIPNQQCTSDVDCTGVGLQSCLNGTCYVDLGVEGGAVTLDRCSANTDCSTNEYCDFGLGRCVAISPRGKECRGYPEDNSPFPASLVDYYNTNPNYEDYGEIKSRPQSLENANFGIWDEDVDCDYQKVEYTGGNQKFFGINSYDPLYRSYKESGRAITPREVSRFLGWRGYCLETDPSRVINNSPAEKACMTWYPIDLIQGEVDIYNSSASAGYTPDLSQQYYCIESRLAEYRVTTPSFKTDNQTQCTDACGASLNPPPYTRSFRWVSPAFDSQFVRCTCSPVGGEGWYDFDGHEPPTNTEIHTEVCTQVAKIADVGGTAQALTSNIYDVAGGYAVPELGYGINQPSGVYGSITPPPGIPQQDWSKQSTIDSFDTEAIPLPVVSSVVYSDCSAGGGYCNVQTNKCEGGDDAGKKCPLPAYNAGSPYACNNTLCPTETGVRVVHQDPNLNGISPYKGDFYADGQDVFTDGIRRISNVFAKSYDSWSFELGANQCFGRCQGGINAGAACTTDDVCIVDVTDEVGTLLPAQCQTNTCTGGTKAGESCTVNSDCRDSQDGLCINNACSHNGASCTTDNDCSVFATGSCVKAKKCVAGSFIGRECNANTDCGNGGLCSEPGTGLCSSDADWLNNKACSSDTDCQGYRSGQCGTTGNFCRGNGTKRGISCTTTADCETNGVCRGPLQCSDGSACNQLGGSCGGTGSITYEQKGCPGEGAQCLISGDGVYRCTSGDRAGEHCVAWDVRSTGELPIIRQTIYDAPNRAYAEGEVGRFTLGNRTSGDLLFYGGVSKGLLANFYAYNRNGQQMPLTEIVIDWGDGKQSFSKGSFKNHKHHCKLPGEVDDAGVPYNFGDTNEACVEDTEKTLGYFSYVHVYDCIGPNDPAWNASVEACEYNPIASVTDNWNRTSSATYNGTVRVFMRP